MSTMISTSTTSRRLRSTSRGVFSVLLLSALVACAKRDAAESATAAASAAPPSPTEVAADEGKQAAGGSMRAASAPAALAKNKADETEKKPGADGEVKTWKRAGSATHATEITIGDKEKLPLRGMQIKVDVDGARARVVIDGYFENDRDRQYEGNFKLRLPNGATPYYFAFGETAFARDPKSTAIQPVKYFSADEERKMQSSPIAIRDARNATWHGVREARMVPKEKAALAYTETVRRQADPALLEWAGAGVFNARVFPLAPHTMNRVVLAYDVPLTEAGNDLEYRLDLPQTDAPVVVDMSSAAAPSEGSHTVRDGARSYGHFERDDTKAITFRWKNSLPQTIVGDDPGVGSSFVTSAKIDLPARATGADSDTGVLVIDTSLSSNPDRFNIYEKLVAATLENNRRTMKKFAVMFFDVSPRWYKPAFIDNTKENADALIHTMDSLSLEGATDLGAALREAAHPSWLAERESMTWDTFLLSDGAPTWGESDDHAMAHSFAAAHRGALFAYNTGIAGTDVSTLASVTRESGGAVFSIVGDAEIAPASTAHKTRAWLIDAVRAKGGADVVLAGRPIALFPGQAIDVAGRGTPEGAIEIDVEQGGEKRTLKIPTTGAVKSSIAPRAYGEIATGQLEEFAPATDDTSKAYAVHYRVTGKTASLLMLDSEEAYARFNIKDEDETARVKSQLATEAVSSAIRAIGETLGDPKIGFLNWLDSLGTRSGVAVDVPKSTRDELAKLPRESFEIRTTPLDIKLTDKNLLASDLREALTKPGSLEYERIEKESQDRLAKYGPGDALRALSSLVEQSPGDAVLARDIAFSAMQMKLDAHAYHLLRRVGAARPWEPQTYRAMAQAAADLGNADLAIGYFEASLAGHWDSRFGEFHKIAAVDYVHLLRKIKKGELKTNLPDFAAKRLGDVSEEVALSGADMVVIITWNTDNSDVDLHVIEPSGEECFYSHRDTKSGGRLTQDVTQGYGPEMYVEKKATRGTYQINAHYFASQRSRASARTKVYAQVIENWGRPDEKITENIVTLVEGKENHEIMTLKR